MAGFMKAQAEQDHSNTPKIWGPAQYLYNATIAQIVGRAIDLVDMTVMALVAATNKWTPLRDVDPVATVGKMVCGAFGSTVKLMKAITDGAFGIGVDGETALSLTGLNFSNVDGPGDSPAKAVCGALGTNLAGMQGVTDGAFKITINGILLSLTGLDFSACHALDTLCQPINAAAAGRFYCEYDPKTTKMIFWSNIAGDQSTISALTAGASGTDISGTGHLNGLTGVATLTQGAGGSGTGETIASVINAAAAGRFTVQWNGTQFLFFSPTSGVGSAISVLTAGASGTDISGASYLNGLTGTGVATDGTGLDGSHLPMGVYRGGTITAAAIAAGDTAGCIVTGNGIFVSEDDLVLENSLNIDTSIIISEKKSIRSYLRANGITVQDTNPVDAQV